MRKILVFGVALMAVCAFSALSTVSAFAALEFTPAKWLVGGLTFSGELLADTLGELLLENTSSGGAIICSGLFEGTVGEGGKDTVTMVYNLATPQELIEELDESGATKGISCTTEKICATGSEVWPLNLPWVTDLVLDTTDSPEKWWDLVLPNANGLLPAYMILCLVGSSSIDELCEAVTESGSEVLNVAGGVEPFGLAEPLGTCGGTKGIADITPIAGGLTSVEGETLSASE